MTRTYANLEIYIQKREVDGYPVKLTINHNQHFPGGYLPADIVEWIADYSPAESGRRLFDLLFTDDQMKTAWAEIRGQEPHRQVRLSIHPEAAELHALPWELLYDTHTLAADTTTPFSRYWESKLRSVPPVTERPIKMLVAIANPENLDEYGLNEVNLEQEKENIRQAIIGIEQVELTFLDELNTGDEMLSTIASELKKGYHILHIVAHGQYNQKKDTAVLFLADEYNEVIRVREEKFAKMFQRQSDHLPQLIFLASCETATRNPADAFRGFAPGLIEAGVPAVVAMQDLVPVETARRFARTFYRQLLDHGLVDLAGNEARADILTAELPGGSIPVLFSRLPDNRLFDVSEAEPPQPRLPFEPETILIPAGPFLMGSEPGEGVSKWESPQFEVELPDYYIGKYPVTNQQYVEFIQQTGHPIAPEADWEGRKPPDNKLNHPVKGVTWYDALVYCDWLTKQTKGQRQYTLPSEAQWEKTARGVDGRIYPWGNEWDPKRCNHGSDETTPVDQYDAQSEFGCYDMVGNVREWTTSLWGKRMVAPDPEFVYPWADDGRRDDFKARNHIFRVYRGGGSNDNVDRLRCSARYGFDPKKTGNPGKRHGFRVVLSL